jgi:hypothetical protein
MRAVQLTGRESVVQERSEVVIPANATAVRHSLRPLRAMLFRIRP